MPRRDCCASTAGRLRHYGVDRLSMWRETDLAGVLISPLVAYMRGGPGGLAAGALLLFEHFRLDRWTYNPPLAEAALYVCILGALVVLL